MDWQDTKSSLSCRFKELYDLNLWTDCNFEVGDGNTEIIKCHKIVLAVSSPVFAALFYGPLADKSSIVKVPDIEPDVFKLLLKYLYCDAVEFTSIQEAGDLLYCAKKYMMDHLNCLCLKYLNGSMQISTMWEILNIAQDFDEEDLLRHCIKVMCRFSSNIWLPSDDFMNSGTLARLLDEPNTNLQEMELWNLVLIWAERECNLKNLPGTAENKRYLINKSGFLKKIRFFTFTKSEFNELIVPTGILNDKFIELVNSSMDKQSLEQYRSEFDFSLNSRHQIWNNDFTICYRQHNQKTGFYRTSGAFKTVIVCNSLILVRGFEVYSQIPSVVDFVLNHGKVNEYHEKIYLRVFDEENNLINESNKSESSTYNTIQLIILKEPFWMKPNKKYSFIFELTQGEYPIFDLSTSAVHNKYNRSIHFCFDDFCQLSNSTLEFSSSKFTFLGGILFNV